MPFSAKDFTLVKRAGVYHLFYTQHDTSAAAVRNEYRFGHAITRDFYKWAEQAPVLDVAGGLWEHDRVWAPSMVERDSLYYLFYTGVNRDSASGTEVQSIGLAVSSDLYDWVRQPAPVFTCAQVPWSFCDPQQPLGGDFRDPFVMQDPASTGWLLYYSTRPAAEPAAMIAGRAWSPDLWSWQDEGPEPITHYTTSFSYVAESPHVFSHAGVCYLVWTTNAGQPLVFATASDPRGPWTWRGRISWMTGLNTATWYASETLQDGIFTYFAFVNYDRVDVRRIGWSAVDDTWILVQPDTFHVFNMYWDEPEVVFGQQVQLRLEALGSIGRTVGLELYDLDADGTWDRLDNAQHGLPDAVVFTQRSHTLTWAVPRADDTDEADVNVEYLVRLADGTLQSPVLVARPEEADAFNPKERRRIAGDGDLVDFRLVSVAQGAAGPALLLVMERPGRARVELFDLAGRRVARLLDEALPAGHQVVPLGEALRGVAPGIYFARAATPGRSRVVRLPVPG